MMEPIPGGAHKSRGFGFVNFEDHSSSEAAVAALNGKTVDASGAVVPAPAPATEGAEAAPLPEVRLDVVD